jgi:serine/threonine-protein kinase HipA
MNRCLYCYQNLDESLIDFHPRCVKKFFGVQKAPQVEFSEHNLEKEALKFITRKMAVTGVQPKLSLDLEKSNKEETTLRLTIVGLWGQYILKPQTLKYSQLPEIESLTMHLAQLIKIKTVPHSLIRMPSGNLAYITKRIDRIANQKLHMEDMCQLTERLTEYKYDGSYEQIAKTILKYSTQPMLDIINFIEQLMFSFIVGNADMHLKNFSLIDMPNIGYILSPAYDLVATSLINHEDKEELALTLNGKKNKISKYDFDVFMAYCKLNNKQQNQIYSKFANAKQKWDETIDSSFLLETTKIEYKELIINRLQKIEIFN